MTPCPGLESLFSGYLWWIQDNLTFFFSQAWHLVKMITFASVIFIRLNQIVCFRLSLGTMTPVAHGLSQWYIRHRRHRGWTVSFHCKCQCEWLTITQILDGWEWTLIIILLPLGRQAFMHQFSPTKMFWVSSKAYGTLDEICIIIHSSTVPNSEPRCH